MKIKLSNKKPLDASYKPFFRSKFSPKTSKYGQILLFRGFIVGLDENTLRKSDEEMVKKLEVSDEGVSQVFSVIV